MNAVLESHVAMNLRRLRRHRGWTLGDACTEVRSLGWPIRVSTLSKIETGQRKVTATEAAAFCDLYDVTLDDLVGGAADELDDITDGLVDDAVIAWTDVCAARSRVDGAARELNDANDTYMAALKALSGHVDAGLVDPVLDVLASRPRIAADLTDVIFKEVAR
jgi:transcriptional regulator with XRE-family HTH domain